jgi:hypothetical protein
MSISQNFPEIKPSLNLDFANVKALDSRITFARASTGAYYDGQTVAKAEENLLLQSQTFDNAYWTKTNITVTANSTTAPDGTTTAESILETATTGSHQVFRSAVITSSNTHVRSVFAKPNGRNWLAIYGGAGRSFFDLQNGVTGTVEAGYTASMIDAGNGWYRCILIGPAGTSSYAGLYNIADADNSISYAGDITKGLFIWGAQFEQRSSVTAYTPTTTQPITNYIPALQTAASGVARFDHDPVTTESLGLLIEEQRTNLFTYSEDFGDASWINNDPSFATKISNTVIAPDGTLTADKIQEATGTVYPFIYKNASVSSGVTYTQSYYVKSAGRQWVYVLTFYVGGNYASGAYFDIVNGVVGNVTAGQTASITPVGNGWFKISVTGVTASVSPAYAGCNPTSDNNVNPILTGYTGDGYSGIYIWGAQLEAGAFSTSYIKTEASQVTRSADSASMTGTNFSEWYRADEGTLYGEYVSGESQGTQAVAYIGDNTVNNRIVVYDDGTVGVGSDGYIIVASSGVTQALINLGTSSRNQKHKIIGAYKTNDFAGSFDGGSSSVDTLGIVPLGLDRLILADAGGVASSLNGHLRKFAYYPARLTNEQLVALTS